MTGVLDGASAKACRSWRCLDPNCAQYDDPLGSQEEIAMHSSTHICSGDYLCQMRGWPELTLTQTNESMVDMLELLMAEVPPEMAEKLPTSGQWQKARSRTEHTRLAGQIRDAAGSAFTSPTTTDRRKARDGLAEATLISPLSSATPPKRKRDKKKRRHKRKSKKKGKKKRKKRRRKEALETDIVSDSDAEYSMSELFGGEKERKGLLDEDSDASDGGDEAAKRKKRLEKAQKLKEDFAAWRKHSRAQMRKKKASARWGPPVGGNQGNSGWSAHLRKQDAFNETLAGAMKTQSETTKALLRNAETMQKHMEMESRKTTLGNAAITGTVLSHQLGDSSFKRLTTPDWVSDKVTRTTILDSERVAAYASKSSISFWSQFADFRREDGTVPYKWQPLVTSKRNPMMWRITKPRLDLINKSTIAGMHQLRILQMAGLYFMGYSDCIKAAKAILSTTQMLQNILGSISTALFDSDEQSIMAITKAQLSNKGDADQIAPTLPFDFDMSTKDRMRCQAKNQQYYDRLDKKFDKKKNGGRYGGGRGGRHGGKGRDKDHGEWQRREYSAPSYDSWNADRRERKNGAQKERAPRKGERRSRFEKREDN